MKSGQQAAKTLQAWGSRSSFRYLGLIESGTRITYGKGYTIFVTPEHYSSLLRHFQGMTVDVGTSRIDPPAKSVGEWLQANVTKTAIASYLCPILIEEGFAERVGESQIAFVRKEK